MKKIMATLGLIALIGLLLLGCSENEKGRIIADVKDFEHVYYESGRYKLSLQENNFIIVGTYDPFNKKYAFDNVLFSEESKSGDHAEKEYKNAEVKTDGKYYYIKAEDLNLKLEKMAEHIIVDEYRNEFIKKKIAH